MQTIVLNDELKFLAVSFWIDPQVRLYSKHSAVIVQSIYAKVG